MVNDDIFPPIKIYRPVVLALAFVLAACTGSSDSGSSSSGNQTPVNQQPGKPAAIPNIESPLRRLTHAEYDNTVRDLLGLGPYAIDFPGEALYKGMGDHAQQLTVSTGLAVAYMNSAVDIAETIVQDIERLTGCEADKPSNTCILNFIERFAGKLFRRPATDEEVADYMLLYEELNQKQNHQTAVKAVIEAILMSPKFLYLVEKTSGTLTDYEIASRMSYLVWDSAPDAALLNAAEQGKLRDSNERLVQIERMLADPKAKLAIVKLYSDWFGLLPADALADNMELPLARGELEYNRVKNFLLDWLLENKEFEAFYTALSPTDPAPGVPDSPDFAAGFLGLRAWISSHSAAEEMVPIHRGVYTLERVLCSEQPVPGNAPGKPERKANQNNRDWLELHRADGSCNACHRVIDPYGLVYEQFDDRGRYRLLDKIGGPVDASSELLPVGDVSGFVSDLEGFASLISESETARECMAKMWYRSALGRETSLRDSEYLSYLTNYWKYEGGSAVQVIKALVTSDLFITKVEVAR